MALTSMRYTPMSLDAMEGGRGASPAPPLRACVGRRAALLAVAGVAVVAVGALARGRGSGPPLKRGDLGVVQEKSDLLALADALAEGLESGAKVAEDVKEAYPNMKEVWGQISEPTAEFKREVAGLAGKHHLIDLKEMASLTSHDLLHPKNITRNDGNPCPDDEEEHMGMCYEKCTDLTGGEFPIRSSAWSCCQSEPCSFFNSKFVGRLIPCQGFDVSGGVEGKGCPHALGACMPNEELSLGICYKKCAILTNNTYPYRSAASSCCRYKSHLACLDALNVISSPSYDTAGGDSDDEPATPSWPHKPMPELAEVQH